MKPQHSLKKSPVKAPAERVVKDIRRQTRRHFSAEDKIRIVLDGLRGDDSIAELCRKEGIAQSLYYVWSKEFMEAGKRRLAGDTVRAATTGEVQDLLGTQDFEFAIRALENAARILPAYVPQGAAAAAKMLEHAAALKEILVQTIAGNHPHIPPEIEDAKFWACRRFLAHFLAGAKAGCVFTLNYDLLLYWTLMHDDMPFDDPIEMAINDGFGNDEDEPDADYVVWQGETNAHSASVHFIHGALHLFDSGKELQKYTWVRKGVPLVDQARAALARNAFPLFVAEGTSAQKKTKIRHNAYLYQGFKQFTVNAQQGKHCMFIFGHSLAENDCSPSAPMAQI